MSEAPISEWQFPLLWIIGASRKHYTQQKTERKRRNLYALCEYDVAYVCINRSTISRNPLSSCPRTSYTSLGDTLYPSASVKWLPVYRERCILWATGPCLHGYTCLNIVQTSIWILWIKRWKAGSRVFYQLACLQLGWLISAVIYNDWYGWYIRITVDIMLLESLGIYKKKWFVQMQSQ